jgi:outer membrane protein insertion porin family
MFYFGVGAFFLPTLSLSDVSTSLREEIDLRSSNVDLSPAFMEMLASRQQVKKLKLQADIPDAESDLYELLDFAEGSLLTSEQVTKSLTNLHAKRLFDKAILTVEQQHDGISMGIALKASWAVSSVHVTGSLVGKDSYRRYYDIEPGDTFSLTKHYRCIHKLLQAFKAQGYYDTVIHATLTPNYEHKLVSVTLSLDPGTPYTVNDITLTLKGDGNVTREDLDTIRTKIKRIVLGHTKGSSFNVELLQDMGKNIHRYLARKGFFNPVIHSEISINQERKWVRPEFTLSINRKKQFDYVGNHFFSSEELLKIITAFGACASLIPSSLIAEEITELYKNRGFWNVEVTYQEEPNSCFFIIKEGPRARITQVRFENLLAFENGVAQTFFKEFLQATFFSEDLLRRSIDNLMQAYNEQGFWSCTVVKKHYEQELSGGYALVLSLNEGKQLIVSHVTLTDPCPLIQNSLSQALTLAHPIPLTTQFIREQQHHLTSMLHKEGYLYLSVKPHRIENPDLTITLQWEIVGNPCQVHFGRTIVAGNSKFQSKVLLRELTYKQGDLWDKEKIDSSLARLKGLGICDSLALSPLSLDKQEPYKVMVLRANYYEPCALGARFGAHFSGTNLAVYDMASYRLGGSFLWKNPLKQADALRVDLDINRHLRTIQAWYKMPWIAGFPLQTAIQAYSFKRDNFFIPDHKQRLCTSHHYGLLARFNKIFSGVSLGFSTGIEWQALDNVSLDLAKSLEFTPLTHYSRGYLTFEPAITAEFVDDKAHPTSGSLTSCTVKGLVPWSRDIPCQFKLLFEQTFFVPCSSLVLATRLRMGHIFNVSFKHLMPNDRFYLGGPSSLRGYEADAAPPWTLYRDPADDQEYPISLGGRTMVNSNFELRFPIWGMLGAVLFTDIGMLSRTFDECFQAKNLVGTTGFGLRYDTPLGPLRFDIGWQWFSDKHSKHRYAWFFTLGHAF